MRLEIGTDWHSEALKCRCWKGSLWRQGSYLVDGDSGQCTSISLGHLQHVLWYKEFVYLPHDPTRNDTLFTEREREETGYYSRCRILSGIIISTLTGHDRYPVGQHTIWYLTQGHVNKICHNNQQINKEKRCNVLILFLRTNTTYWTFNAPLRML